MKNLLKMLIIPLIITALTSCVSPIPKESIDENSSGIYGYFEFDEDSKFYNMKVYITFSHVDSNEKWYFTTRSSYLSEDHSFWIPNIVPGIYAIDSVSYNWGNSLHYIDFNENEYNFDVGKGELYYWGAVYCEERDDSYLTEPHMEVSKEDVLNFIEAKLLEDNWGEWLERERETLK